MDIFICFFSFFFFCLYAIKIKEHALGLMNWCYVTDTKSPSTWVGRCSTNGMNQLDLVYYMFPKIGTFL